MEPNVKETSIKWMMMMIFSCFVGCVLRLWVMVEAAIIIDWLIDGRMDGMLGLRITEENNDDLSHAKEYRSAENSCASSQNHL